ncbi:unnamed protein product [Paramecium sonneborni]|uniref:Uncharacterized protein n=1 Tax=Paramecium sonneborni TaxID=65129 RepID=A0A8S1L6N6_9CILI|nr:unnamed protein product [Paramecium sonneborni]
MKKSNLNSENYWKTLVQCINALNYNNKIGKNITQKVKNVMKAQDYKFWVNLLSQTKKEKDFYKRQFESLNLIQKFEQQNKINLNIEVKFKFPILNQKNNIEYVILEDQENKEYIIMNSDIKYYVSYFKEDNYSKITIAIIKDSQLYWGLGNIHEIEIKNDENDKKINLDKIIYFQNNFNSSFLLDQYKFYQFNLDLNSKNQFVGTVFIYDFKGNQNLIKFQVKSDHQIISHIKGFTAIKHSDSSFSLLSGCKDGNLYQQIGIKLDLVEGNSLKLSQYKKQNSQLPKGYDYPLIVQLQKNNDQKNESTRFIYFESQTRYFAVPCISEIYQVNFQLNQFDSTCRCDKFQNVSDIHLIQNYSRLFRSDQSNIKYEIINSNAIALELVVFEQNLQRNKLEDQIYSKDIKLQKNLQCNYMHFKFIFQQQQMLLMKIKINLNESSMLFQSLNDNLNQICLYDNWLEDQNIPHIFLYNSKQHIYLLYYQKDKSGLYETKYFIFQCRKNQKECMPFDEVIINDYYNCVIWIVRKYNDRKYPYLVIYNCHWMSLQEVKEEDINRRKEVYMDKVYEINRFTEEFDLMGLEIENQNNILIIFNSKFICNVPIQLLRNQNFSLFIKQLKSGILFDEIFYFDLKFSLKTAISILNLSENKIAFFYQYCIEYCIADCIDENKVLYQIEIQGKILNIKGNNNQKLQYNSNQQNRGEYLNDENQISIKQQFNYKASSSLILARLISIQMQNQFLQSLIFLEEEYQQFYAVQLQFSLKSNETVILRMIKLKQSFGNLKILTSISTNKAETLFLCDNQIEIIRSVRSLETLQ